MRGALAATLLLASLVLAGCSGADDPATAADTPDVITDPRDVAASDQPGSHIHDYWGGRDRVPVLDAEGGTWSSCSGSCDDGMPAAWSRPKDGLIVPQGTRWVNGTFSFTPEGSESDYRTLELWVKTANDSAPRRVGPIHAGEAFSIESTQEDNDPPHYVLSLWEFEVVATNGGGDVTIRGDFHWVVEAVRGLPLVPYPPHPDHWGGADHIDLLTASGGATLAYETDTTSVCYASVSQCPGRHAMPDGVVVPADTTRVEVRLTSVTPGLGLMYHGADTRAPSKATGRMDGLDTVFDLTLAANQADSPYARQSLWEFEVVIDEPTPVEAWSGEYTLKAVAHK